MEEEVERAWNWKRNVRIALLTANFQERVQIKAEDLGLSFYAKPVTLDKVTDFMTAQSS